MKNGSILIVDDNSIALKELHEILRYLSINDVKLTKSTNEAWAIMKSKTFDCIISSWDMDEMSGLALLRLARKEDSFFRTPIFLAHDAFTKVKVIQAGQSGVTGLLVKPYNVKIIKSKIADLPEAVLKPEPTPEEKKYSKGMNHLEKGNYHKAIDIFDKITTESETAEYYYNLGYTNTIKEKYEEAIRSFKKATELDRLYVKAFEAMGHAYNKIGREKESAKYLQMAADIHMDNENTESAEEILNDILKISPETLNVYNSLGVLYRKKGELEKSLKFYMKALKIHEKEPSILYNIGRLHLDMKNTEKGKLFFEKAVKSNPKFKEAKQVLKAIELGSI